MDLSRDPFCPNYHVKALQYDDWATKTVLATSLP